MKIIKYPKRETWEGILKRAENENFSSLEGIVSEVLKEVRKSGDKALRKYTEKFDKVKLNDLKVSHTEIKDAVKLVNKDLKDAINKASKNIEKFHKQQIEKKETIVETMPGVKCWQKSVAIERVGIYIPGGTAPLFSTVLMLGIPAKLAGCKGIILCTPPDKSGKVNPVILYTAHLLGISQIFKIGGIQAIGAMAYGTETVPKIFKIFGPGNSYVTTAKQMVANKDVAIDMPAGPSELAIIADEYANPEYMAADLLSQLEHGPDSQVILATSSEIIIDKVNKEIKKQLAKLPRKNIAEKSLQNSKCILLKNDAEIMDLINEYAPEHLIINTKNYEALSKKVINAGSVFLGENSTESIGDYASGTNHTLPTHGHAKAYSGVNMDSFMKKITFQEVSEKGLINIGRTVEVMAEAEELMAHKNAVSIRLKIKN